MLMPHEAMIRSVIHPQIGPSTPHMPFRVAGCFRCNEGIAFFNYPIMHAH